MRVGEGGSLDSSTLQAAIYASLDANNIETDAHCVHVSMLPHDTASIYIVLSSDAYARFRVYRGGRPTLDA